jgi:DNA polymerase IV
VPIAVFTRSDLEHLAIALLQGEMPLPKPVRLLGGISLSPLKDNQQAEPQFDLQI